MATPKKRRAKRKVKRKVKLKQSAKLIQRNDATRVEKRTLDSIPRMSARPPADAAPTFRIKIRRK